MPNIHLDPGNMQLTESNSLAGESLRIDSSSVLQGLEAKGLALEGKEQLSASLDALIQEFEIDSSVFNSTKGVLTMVAIADRHRKIVSKSEQDGDPRAVELENIADLVMLAAGPQTKFAVQYEKSTDVSGVSDEALKEAYDRFTQPELTADLKTYINGPDFDDLRKRLGKDVEMDVFDVRVLSIAAREDIITYGLMPSVDWEDESLSYQEKQQEHESRREYEEGLFRNGDKFKEAVGRETSIPPAWVNTDSNGKKTLCMPSATAEKILYPDEARASHYDEDARQDDIATLQHEFVHTQGMLLFGGRIGLGIALEELRAEHFSGDQHGYTDIKKFFQGMGMITGYTPKKAFERDEQSFDEERFMLDIAGNIGLDGLLDTLTAVPKNYVEDEHANPYLKSMVENNGDGLSGLLEKVYVKAVERDGEEVVEQRMNEAVDKIRAALKDASISVESWFSHGSPAFFARLGINNFRSRYPNESDNYAYSSLEVAT